MVETIVTDHPERNRFEASIDGELAGFAEYMIANRLIIFTHTEVEPRFEGQGVGSALVKQALDAVRAEGTREVMPLCPFVNMWVRRHPEYQDVLFAPQPSKVTD